MGPERLIVWLDDDISDWTPTRQGDSNGEFHPELIAHNPEQIKMMVRPNTLYIGPWCGLLSNHLAMVDEHLADPSLAKGKAIYDLACPQKFAKREGLGGFTKVVKF